MRFICALAAFMLAMMFAQAYEKASFGARKSAKPTVMGECSPVTNASTYEFHIRPRRPGGARLEYLLWYGPLYDENAPRAI